MVSYSVAAKIATLLQVKCAATWISADNMEHVVRLPASARVMRDGSVLIAQLK